MLDLKRKGKRLTGLEIYSFIILQLSKTFKNQLCLIFFFFSTKEVDTFYRLLSILLLNNSQWPCVVKPPIVRAYCGPLIVLI